MATEVKPLQYDKSYIQHFSEGRNEPQWLTDLRLRALASTDELPMPQPEKTRIIGWNFTEFDHDVPSQPLASLDDLPENVRTLAGKEQQTENLLIHRDQTKVHATLSEDLKQKGVIFTDMKTALSEHGDLVHKYFMNAVDAYQNRLTAIHAALMNCGTFLYVPKNVEITLPMQSIYWKDNPAAGLINHVLIVAEDHSSVTYVENYTSEDAGHSTSSNVIAEVFVGQNAKVTYGAVDNFADDVTTYVDRTAQVSRDGRMEWALGYMNDGNTLYGSTTHLVGDGSYADIKSVAVGRGEQRQNYNTRLVHHGKNTEGFILTHGVMKDKAQAIFNGISKIEHGASRTNSQQSERVLMLSRGSRGDANPILLIDEDDVEAGHAASVGRVDPVQMYYLMSRGISREEAQRLIIRGFLEPVVKQLPVQGVKDQLDAVIERKVH